MSESREASSTSLQDYEAYCEAFRAEYAPPLVPASYENWVAFNEVMDRG